MRRFLMWMMICLLPLRLWAGDAIAVQHAPPAVHEAGMLMAQDAHPCHGADATTDGVSDPAAGNEHRNGHGPQHGNGHSNTCGDCSVCHGPLAGVAVPNWATPVLPRAVPQALGWSALSANALPHLKPPRA